jgi:hypothetical protein
MRTARIALLIGTLLSSLASAGCGDGTGLAVDASMDATSARDAFARDTNPYPDGPPLRDATPDGPAPTDAFSPDAFSSDAFSPDAFRPDAFRPDAATRGCGYNDGEGFVCGGGSIPGALCDGDDCCEGVCMPGGMNQVCCNRATGVLTICSYSAGACPCETQACD